MTTTPLPPPPAIVVAADLAVTVPAPGLDEFYDALAQRDEERIGAEIYANETFIGRLA